MTKLAHRIFEIYCKTVFKVYCPLKIVGQERLPKSRYLLCSNHQSHMDSGVLMAATGKPFSKCGMVAAKLGRAAAAAPLPS